MPTATPTTTVLVDLQNLAERAAFELPPAHALQVLALIAIAERLPCPSP